MVASRKISIMTILVKKRLVNISFRIAVTSFALINVEIVKYIVISAKYNTIR